MFLTGKEKILICDFRRIGDGIMSLPIFEALKKRYPNCTTGFICENIAEGIADNNPYIDEVFYFNKNSFADVIKLIFEVRKRKYDISIDSLGMPKTAIMGLLSGAGKRLSIHKHLSFFYTNVFTGNFEGVYSAHHKMNVLKLIDAFPKKNSLVPFFNITEKEKEEIKITLDSLNIKEDFFTSSPASKIESTQLDPKEWANLYNWLINKYEVKIILQYAPSEKEYIKDIYQYIEKKDYVFENLEFQRIREVIVLLSFSKFHLAQNNGSKHLANGVKTPCLTLWGSESTYNNWKIPLVDSVDEIIWARNYQEDGITYNNTTEPIPKEVIKEKIVEVIKCGS